MQFSFLITYNQKEIPLAMTIEFLFIAFITVAMMFCFLYKIPGEINETK